MLDSMRCASRRLAFWCCTICVAGMLQACGSGGSSSGAASNTGSAASAPTLSGVAAVGSPLLNAQISVIDASGAAMGSATAASLSGAYTLTLASSKPVMPLLVQARGLDATGTPRVLHSVVPQLASAMVANVTPLSNAIVAMSLGVDPAPLMASPKGQSKILALLSSATAAETFLSTVIAANISDAKFASGTTVDLLGDGTFVANKSPQDVLLESLRVNLVTTSSGTVVLELGNKFLASPVPEVTISVATASAQLALTSGTPANAITSTTTTTSSSTTVAGELPTLDTLGAAINTLLAQGTSAAKLETNAVLSSYTLNNGRKPGVLAAQLAALETSNLQLGKFQATACADAVIAKGKCTLVSVGAPITNSSGQVVQFFSDTLVYVKTPATGAPNWVLGGNNQALEFSLYPLQWTQLRDDGTADPSLAGGLAAGIQILLQAYSPDTPPVQLLGSATVQTPGGFSIAFANCDLNYACITSTPGATSTTATGGAADQTLVVGTAGWISTTDIAQGDRYVASYTTMLAGATAVTQGAYLNADLNQTLNLSRMPQLDGVSRTSTLSGTALLNGMTVAWSTWAAANPDMRLLSVRTVVDGTVAGVAASPIITDLSAPLPPSTSVSLAAPVLGAGFTATGYKIWLTALDALGRKYLTCYTLGP